MDVVTVTTVHARPELSPKIGRRRVQDHPEVKQKRDRFEGLVESSICGDLQAVLQVEEAARDLLEISPLDDVGILNGLDRIVRCETDQFEAEDPGAGWWEALGESIDQSTSALAHAREEIEVSP